MSKHYPFHEPLRCWADADRPREKMMLNGRNALSDAELIAILLGSGSKSLSAIGLAVEILDRHQNNLIELSRTDHHQLMKIHGVGPAKALVIVAALELGRRRQQASALEKPSIVSSRDAYLCVKSNLEDLDHEEFWVLFLNQANKLLRQERFSKGGLTGTVADSRIIFMKALEIKATGMILAHNHPSGNCRPSEKDIELTQRFKAAALQLEIKLLDHLILTADKYYSFADQGIL